MTTTQINADPIQLTAAAVSALPLPRNYDTDWAAYYGTWRLRRRLLDALAKADEMGISYADLTLTEPANYLHLIKAVRARCSAEIAKAAAIRRKERVRKQRAAVTQSAA